MEGKSIYYVLKAFLFIIPLCIVQNNSGQLPAGRVTDKAGRSFRQLKIPIAHKAFDFSHIGGKMGRYTDLAAEMRELNPDIEGIREEETNDGEIKIKRIEILSDTAAHKLGKAQGKYITLDAEALTQRPLDLFAHVSQCLRRELTELIPLPETKLKSGTVLVVGLGNRGVTPDSLGPRVAERVFVTRHIKEHMPEAFDFDIPSVCAIAPGVLGVTGVETMDIVFGVANKVKPDLIIAVDALASRRAARISTTIQLSDSGISPGSGVGNTRADLSRANLGVPVIAVGVPLVVYASTISQDTISLIADETGLHGDEERLRELAEQVIAKHMGDFIVTPKDIDVIVEDDAPIPALPIAKIGDTEKAIGEKVASLIKDGDCLQLGIGSIPDAVLTFLGGKKDLGIHSDRHSSCRFSRRSSIQLFKRVYHILIGRDYQRALICIDNRTGFCTARFFDIPALGVIHRNGG